MVDKGGLREFVCVVEQGSFTAAADELNVSASFVSREVKRLEERLDTRLLHRTTRSLSLTEMGKVFYQRGKEIQDALNSLEEEIADLQEHPKGLVRITATGLYAENYVAPALAEFTNQYPDVSIELDTTVDSRDLVADGFDLAIRTGVLPDSTLIARRIAPRRIVTCASPSYLDRKGVPNTPQDLYQHNCLQVPTMSWRYDIDGVNTTIRVKGSWQSDNVRALIAAAVRGAGIVRMTDYYMEEELRSGELCAVLEGFEPTNVYTHIVFPARDHLPTRVRFLIDYLAERLRRTNPVAVNPT